jgi:2-keto-4-pentenoate hydratase/2-oxohepta-3-ene-1,7-dioic acid hydratase in catechol pathway
MKITHLKIKNTIGLEELRLGALLTNREHSLSFMDFNLVHQKHFAMIGFKNTYERANHHCPPRLSQCLTLQENPLLFFQETFERGERLQKLGEEVIFPIHEQDIGKPLDHINTYRDFFTHEKHVATGFAKRQESIPAPWFEMPVYYKGATAGFIGPEEIIPWPSYSDVLDYELELAAVMARDGKNIKANLAHQYLLGFTILNDISARDIQRKEMMVRLGPSKGKDFCSVIGPVITTIDEFKNSTPNLKMTATINGEQWSLGQSGDARFSFAEMIEFASRDEWLLATDLLGSGTVGTGCGLELDRWIQPGDIIELEIEHIGRLRNRVGDKGILNG